jgi:hypothetical protein
MKRLLFISAAALFVASCNPDTIDFSNAGESATQLAILPEEIDSIPDTLALINDAATPIIYADLGVSQAIPVKVQIPVIPDGYIEPSGLIEQFRDLAKFTNGSESYVAAAREVTKTCIGILDTHLVDNSDVVFQIDATASMLDDIDNVKRGVTTIIEHIRQHENVRVGVSIYRDVKDGRAFWFDCIQLTANYDSVIDFVNSIAPCCGSSDWAESVYDGACVTLDTMNWRPQSPKMILLIGDAPALLGPYTNNTLEDVVAKSKEHGVQMNFYPVIITTDIAIWNPVAAPKKTEFMTKMYPSPTNGPVTIELNFMAAYSWRVNDLGGSMLQEGSGYTNRIQLDLTTLPNGVYSVQVTKDGVMESKLIVVAH